MEHSSIAHFFLENGPIYGSLVIGFLSGIIPILNIELYLIFLALKGNFQNDFLLISFLASLGQTISKIIVYKSSLSVGALKSSKKINMQKIKDLSEKFMKNDYRGDLLIFASASVGLPPVLLTPIVAGLARYPLVRFVFIVLIGRWLRFWACLAFPAHFHR